MIRSRRIPAGAAEGRSPDGEPCGSPNGSNGHCRAAAGSLSLPHKHALRTAIYAPMNIATSLTSSESSRIPERIGSDFRIFDTKQFAPDYISSIKRARRIRTGREGAVAQFFPSCRTQRYEDEGFAGARTRPGGGLTTFRDHQQSPYPSVTQILRSTGCRPRGRPDAQTNEETRTQGRAGNSCRLHERKWSLRHVVALV